MTTQVFQSFNHRPIKVEPITLSAVKSSLRTLLLHRNEKSLNYAINYAEYALSVTTPSEMRVQLLYILNNMTHWRGMVATDVRNTFKRFIVENGR